jgi:hypothetical protein
MEIGMPDLGAVGASMGSMIQIRQFDISVALPPATVSVSGVISDDTATPVARTVRAYVRGTGQLIGETTSDAVTGAYSLACPPGEIQRVVLDDAAGTLYNDIIDRVIPA